MAFTSFYLIASGTGAADINAGSSTGAAQATTTNGNWSSATGVFTAASGTPFAATIVGDYASVYVDGATVTTFIGIVTAATSSTIITVDVATIKYGTAPSTSVTGRSCTINGAWATEQVLAAGGLATTTVPQSTKINIKGNLTIAATRTISMAGATTTPLWFSGYNTTPGDLDADTTNSLAKPIWTLSATFQLLCSGVHQIWSGLSLTGNRSGFIWRLTAANRLLRCRGENTSSNAAASVLTADSSNNFQIAYSWFKAPTTANGSGVVDFGTSQGQLVGCVFEGGGLAGFGGASANIVLLNCVALNPTGSGFRFTTGLIYIHGCTVYNATVDGVRWTGTPGAGSVVTACLFNICGGYGINNASGTNTNNVFRACNDFYSCTSNPENGFGDSPAFFQQTDSSGVVTSATDMTPIASSNAINHGFPGIFENESFSSYAPIGSVTPVSAGGFTGIIGGGF